VLEINPSASFEVLHVISLYQLLFVDFKYILSLDVSPVFRHRKVWLVLDRAGYLDGPSTLQSYSRLETDYFDDEVPVTVKDSVCTQMIAISFRYFTNQKGPIYMHPLRCPLSVADGKLYRAVMLLLCTCTNG